jgi:exopolyphosphatase / guanosine-5'-triphosphate,3'-diphosphate pyrophosphatase
MPPARVAVVDLGSNSFRLVVFSAGDGWWKRTDEIHEPVRIGEGLAATGALGAAPMRRALAALDVFAHFARATGLAAGDVDAVATSAIRDATNAEEFLGRAREATGLPVRVLSREQEARYGYLAAVNSSTLADGCVLDLGGGSMQLVQVASRHSAASQSWPLGAVRMTERFLPGAGTSPPSSRAPAGCGAGRAGWSASAARSATSPPQRSTTPACPASACRASASPPRRSTR